MNEKTKPIVPSITVDGSWLPKVGMIQYRFVDTQSSMVLYDSGPIMNGTNNVAEYLALTSAMIYCHKKGLNLPIYSDSVTALAWVRKRKINTDMSKITDKKLLSVLSVTEEFLKKHGANFTLLKWDTKQWGENRADFGRK